MNSLSQNKSKFKISKVIDAYNRQKEQNGGGITKIKNLVAHHKDLEVAEISHSPSKRDLTLRK